MYFGSVKFFKHLIVGVTLLLIIIPTVLAIVFGIKLAQAEKAETVVKDHSGTSAADALKKEYTGDELFGIYKDHLSDKEGFLKKVCEYDNELFSSVSAGNPVTQAPAPETIEAVVSQKDDSLTLETEVRPAYEKLYPDLYAKDTDNIVYNLDMDYVYLTFDDGPSKYTKDILNYLDAYDIKATFFVVPDGSEECAKRLKAIADAGHTIGIHTATHEYNKIYKSVENYLEDFKTAYDRVYEATGIQCSLFRFPGGSINDYNGAIREELIAEMTRRGFIYFDWNVDSSDALGASWTEMYNNVLTQTANANRAVVLMHDYNGGYSTVLVLEDIIKALIGSTKRSYKLDRLTVNVKPVQF